MRDDFEVCIGGAGALRVHASVTNRDSREVRASLVVIRNDETGDELWLNRDDALRLGRFLLNGAHKDPETGVASEGFSSCVADAEDAIEIRTCARDLRHSAITVLRKDSTSLSRYVIRAAEAVSMIERLDAMDEAPNPESPFSRA